MDVVEAKFLRLFARVFDRAFREVDGIVNSGVPVFRHSTLEFTVAASQGEDALDRPMAKTFHEVLESIPIRTTAPQAVIPLLNLRMLEPMDDLRRPPRRSVAASPELFYLLDVHFVCHGDILPNYVLLSGG